MTTEPVPQPKFSERVGSAARRLFAFLFRLVFVLLLAVGIGAGVYFGAPYLYRTLVEPVQANSTALSALSGRVDILRASFAESQAAQDGRITTLETGNDAGRERIAAAESQVADLKSAVDDEAAARELLATDVRALQSDAESQAAEIAALNAALTQMASLSGEVENLNRQIVLLRMRNDLLQARLQINAENLGQARLILQPVSADMIAFVNATDLLPADTRAALANRLLTAQQLTAAQPAAALDELDSVWAQLDRAVNPGE